MLKAANLIPKRRLFVASGIVILLMMSLLIRFFSIQVHSYEKYSKKAEVNRIRAIPLNAPRGLILDRNGEIIVDNYPTYVLTVIPGEMIDKRKNFNIISQCTGIDTTVLKSNYDKYYRGKFLPTRIAKDLTFDQLSRIEEHKTDLTGINYIQFPERIYSGKINASHLLGYVKEVDHALIKELEEPGKYIYGDLVGWRGLEKVYEKDLRGKKGVYFMEVDAFGREMGASTDRNAEYPVPGNNLYTSLFLPLQEMLEKKLDGHKSVALVSNPKNGEILAFVSKPDYPPDLFTGTTTVDDWKNIISDPDKPLLNRITHGLYPPGSTLKMITAMSLLEKRKVSISETVDCQGVYTLGNRDFRCWEENGHGTVNLKEAIAQSCNIYFYHFVQRLSIDEWAESCRLFGFGDIIGFDLGSEAKGVVPNSSYMNKRYGRWGWSKGHLLNVSLGQGEFVATPIQMLQYINLLAMKGRTPILHTLINQESELVEINYFSMKTWDQMESFMQQVIISSRGTGKRSDPKIPGLIIAGKTGTSQNPHGDDHAWYIGYGKYKKDIVSVVILVEEGGHGGVTAAPIARSVFNLLFSSNETMKLVFAE
ncbi:MAG: penicillin-binding protein 2 [Candidatus Marinimicrobia bacterium]|nr:penicillin-binding protein 2 [Candidatus Neomarinimicrobiota bacterium]